MRILVFGDSIAYGAWDSAGGWVERLKSYAHQKTLESSGKNKIQVLNMGVGGHSSGDILNRLENEITSRQSKSWPFLFIFAFGTNDARTYEGDPQNSVDQYLANTESILKIAKKYSDRILFVSPIPVGYENVEFKGVIYSDKKIHEYAEKQKNLLINAGVECLDLWDEFKNSPDNLFCFDGLHPNDKGHELICESVKQKLEEQYGL